MPDLDYFYMNTSNCSEKTFEDYKYTSIISSFLWKLIYVIFKNINLDF